MIYIFTGAGISAESGIPTFRSGNTALWANNLMDEVCNISTFKTNYDKVHEFYNARRMELAKVSPNEAHKMVTFIQQNYGAEVWTTNVDDLHERAGTIGVQHIHGNLLCIKDLDTKEYLYMGYNAFPYKDAPSKSYKPDVVFFGECAPKYQDLLDLGADLTPEDIVIFIGMSFEVVPYEMILTGSSNTKVFNRKGRYSARKLPSVININPDTKTNIRGAMNLNCSATEGLRQVLDMLDKGTI